MRSLFSFTRGQSMVMGIVALLSAALWNYGASLGLSTNASNILLGASIGLLANLFVGFLQSNQSSRELTQAKADLHTATETLVAKVGDSIGEFRQEANMRHETLQKLTFDVMEQVTIIVDTSRKPLENFAAVFAQAEHMIVDRHPTILRILSFTPCFGLIHSYNTSLFPDFYEVMYPEKEWRKDLTDAFQDDLRTRVDHLKSGIERVAQRHDGCFELATFDTETAKQVFMEPLAKKIRDDSPPLHMDIDIVKEVSTDHDIFLQGINLKLKQRNKLEGLSYLQELPLQLILANHGRIKTCLVFFIGSRTLGQDGATRGFYTEYEPLVDLFDSVFDSIVKANKKLESLADEDVRYSH